MNVCFWGVRGDLAMPLLPEQIQAKINAVVQRIQMKDLQSFDSRQKFLASLPDFIYGTAGGNTSCVQLVSQDGKELILDAGTGIHVMGKNSPLPPDRHYSLLLSHLSWDHIQGLPFFKALYNSDITFDIFSPFENAADYISEQMKAPFYPVDFSVVKNRINFITVSAGGTFEAGGLKISCCRTSRPGSSYSYSVSEGGKKIAYGAGAGLCNEDFRAGEDVRKVFENADAAVLNLSTPPETAERERRYAFCQIMDFAAEMNIRKIYLFHYEPSHDDKKLNAVLNDARQYSGFVYARRIEVDLAVEGKSFCL